MLGLVVIAVGGSILFFFRLQPTQELIVPNLELFQQEAGLQARLTGIYMIEEDQGKKTWELWADEAEIYNQGESIILNKIKALLYLEDNNKVKIRGDTGKIYGKTKDMELEGQVVIITQDGTSLLTDYLEWDAQNREMHSPNLVTIKGSGMEVKGKGMVGYPDSETLILKRDVEAIIKQ
jgi:LPS export ABC transporter protein LptC